MKKLVCALCLLMWLSPYGAHADDSNAWQAVVGRMPLNKRVSELNRSNILDVLLNSFGSNNVVKALIFMPGATDGWFFPKDSRVALTNGNSTLLDAINALTNQSPLRVTFRPPFLLVHTGLDQLEPVIIVADPATAEKIKKARYVPHAIFFDRDWDYIVPSLRKSLKTTMRPSRYTKDSWHFYRHSLSAWNLTGWEALEAATLAGRTYCTVEQKKAVFHVDHRLPARTKTD